MAVRVITKSLAGKEDLLLGFGTEEQVRNDKNILITKINASNIPYDESLSVTEKLDSLVAIVEALTLRVEELETIVL